jgi:DNA-binding GntR family transcriptional regulator
VRTVKQRIMESLRQSIVSGQLKPGERLNESALARQFGISRIPVREALAQLQQDGLVMNNPWRGMFVTSLSAEDVQRINGLRVVLEAEALRLCQLRMQARQARRLTQLVERMEAWDGESQLDSAALDLEFHRTIWEVAGNPYLSKALDSLVSALFAHKALEYVSADLKRWRLHHHRELLEVALGRSEVIAEVAIISHLRTAFDAPERFCSYGTAPVNPRPARRQRP